MPRPRSRRQAHPQPLSNNLLAAARDAWAGWKTAEGDQLERVLCIGAAMLQARRDILLALGLPAPTGAYARAMQFWRRDNGFGDMPDNWCRDASWCAEHEAEVRAAYAAAAAARSRGRPSAHPTALMRTTVRARTVGPKRRRSPIERPAFLVRRLERVLGALPPREVFAICDRLTAILEDAVERASSELSASGLPGPPSPGSPSGARGGAPHPRGGEPVHLIP